MRRFIDLIKYDLAFLKSHTLQPKWFKILKGFLLLGFLGIYWLFFGFIRFAIFLVTFLFLMLLIHITYRIKTEKYTRDWLDFSIPRNSDIEAPKRIGKYYYPAIVINILIAFVISQAIMGK
jgi:hypothetical protein